MTGTPDTHEFRVLLVDDEPISRKLLERLLADLGITNFAVNSSEALRLAYDWRPDLILLEVMLPTVNGFEVCRAIRADRRYGNPIIVFLSARDSQEDIVEGLRAGANDYIRKPYDPQELKLRVLNHVKFRREVIIPHDCRS